jgi:hypothetical protein
MYAGGATVVFHSIQLGTFSEGIYARDVIPKCSGSSIAILGITQFSQYSHDRIERGY